MQREILGRGSKLECKLRDLLLAFGVTRVAQLSPPSSIDTGVDFNHPSLGNGQWGPGHKVVGGYDFVGDAYDGAMLFRLFDVFTAQLTALR